MKKTLTLDFKKSTKGTHVYENGDYNLSYVYENGDYNLSFYLPRLMLDNPAKPPTNISITIEADEK